MRRQWTGIAAAVCAAVSLTGCLGPTPYQVKQYNGGYAENPAGPNRWYVEFQGNGYTSRDTVRAYWVYRCAELTQQKGFEYYAVISNPTGAGAAADVDIRFVSGDAQAEDDPAIARRKGGSSGGKGGGYYYTPGGTTTVTTWSARGVIEMYKTPPANESIRVVAAKDILAKLGPAVREAQQAGGNIKMPVEALVIPASNSASAPAGRTDGVGIKLEELDGLLPKE